jgi:hypothetical protein
MKVVVRNVVRFLMDWGLIDNKPNIVLENNKLFVYTKN